MIDDDGFGYFVLVVAGLGFLADAYDVSQTKDFDAAGNTENALTFLWIRYLRLI